VEDYDNHRNHDQDVDERAPDVDHEESQQPQNQQDSGDREKHLRPLCPLGRRSVRTILTHSVPGNSERLRVDNALPAHLPATAIGAPSSRADGLPRGAARIGVTGAIRIKRTMGQQTQRVNETA
jgi:hypothetical protein